MQTFGQKQFHFSQSTRKFLSVMIQQIMQHYQHLFHAILLCFLIGQITSPTVAPNSVSGLSTISYTGGSNRYALITMTLSSAADAGSVIMFVMTSAGGLTTNYTRLSTYQHMSPVLNTYFDLDHANTGQTQAVQLDLGSSATTLHINVFNFQTSKTISYSIASSQSATSDTSFCSNSTGNVLATSIYCGSCLTNFVIGAFCERIDTQILKTVTYKVVLNVYGNSGNYVPFKIQGSEKKITFFYKSNTTNVVSFIQFQERSDDMAGWMNYVANGGKSTVTKVDTQYNVNVISSGKDISVAFWNPNAAKVQIIVWYEEDDGANVLLIILGVLGGVLFVLLLIVAIYIVKKMNSNEMRQVQPNVLLRSRARIQAQENMLTKEEIEIYFPAVLCRNVFQADQNSKNNLMSQNNNRSQQNPSDRQCAICLCPVTRDEMMRVTYCKHIFHAHCLIEWFKKNRNCPYCREEFNKKSTVEHYQSLLKGAHRSMLAGVDLATQIVNSRMNKSSLIIEEIKD